MKTLFNVAFLIAVLLVNTNVFADTVRLMNDSPFTLVAKIIGADGTELTQVQMSPNTYNTWNHELFGFSSNRYLSTPYTVIFYCTNGKEYGIWTNVPQAALVSAQGSVGPRICPVEPKPDRFSEQK